MNELGTVLLAEDDENDVFFLLKAFHAAVVGNPLMVVRDGEEAIQYLRGEGPYADRKRYPLPCLLITDLKMPKLTGFDVLEWIQKNMNPESLPGIVLSTSIDMADKQRALELGAREYWIKPAEFEKLIELAARLKTGWLAASRGV